jgi:hypothetical protein
MELLFFVYLQQSYQLKLLEGSFPHVGLCSGRAIPWFWKEEIYYR